MAIQVGQLDNMKQKSLPQMNTIILNSDISATPEEQRLIAVDDRIDSYLRGQMTKEEESAFIADCKNNKELKERAYITALLTKSLK